MTVQPRQAGGHDPDPGRLALFAALASIFEGTHGLLDQWGQSSWAAAHKRAYGGHRVDRRGMPVDPAAAGPRLTATALGQRAATQHVLYYTAGQTLATAVLTRALGFRMPVRALAAGAMLNGVTHWLIDRHRPLLAAAAAAGKQSYLERCTVVRRPGEPAEQVGPGTAHFELDQSAHRAIGLLAAAAMAWLAVRDQPRAAGRRR